MLKPSFRLFIVPLGAICTIATLSSQNAPQTTQRTSISSQVREQIVDCSQSKAADICLISETLSR